LNEPGLRAVMIRACDRPARLEALLGTLADYEQRRRAGRRYVVLDDSRTPTGRAANGRLVTDFAARCRVPATRVDGTAVVEKVAAAVPEAAPALRFAVPTSDEPGSRPGKGFNLATLLGAGASWVMLDEDNLLDLRRPRDAANGLELGRRAEAGTRFFDDVEEALGAGVEFDEDPIEHALALCGRTVGEAVAGRSELRSEEPLMGGLEDARIATVTHGHRGHSCSATSLWMYLLEGEARASLWRGAERYRRNLRDAAVWWGSRRPFLQPHGNFTPFAVDGTRMVPPTMPDGRGEDLLFGILIAAIDPTAVALHSNLTIGHRQEGARARTALLDRPVTPDFDVFVASLVSTASAALDTLDPGARLLALAQHLRGIEQAPDSELLDRVAEHASQARSQLVQRLDMVVADAEDAPPHWRADVDLLLAVNRRALAEPPPPGFLDWPQPLPLARVRARLKAFAALLEHWPALWERAVNGLL
jgi:hypothetical protein